MNLYTPSLALLERTADQAVAEAATPQGKVGIAIIGCGYWGNNLLRNFQSCPTARIAAVCDERPDAVSRFSGMCPTALPTADFQSVLDEPSVDAVAIATPVATHGQLCIAALRAGKHVLVEKPMALSLREAEDLVRLADREGLTLMVDHTFIFSEPVRKIKQLIDAGELGDILYIDSVRINLGLFQNDVNVIWDLAPHDLSIVEYLVGRMPRSVAATGTCHTRSDLEDVAYLNLDFGGNLMASFHVNWLSPVKVRQLMIGGSKKSLIYNDLNTFEPIKVYDRGISITESPASSHLQRIDYRSGDAWCPHVQTGEPLQNVVRHFTDCIRTKRRPLTDGEAGLRVVRFLEAAQRSIKAQGGRITL